MNPTHLHQQQQQQTWEPPAQHAFASTSASDSDYWDTAAQLLASLDDPELIEISGDAEPESEDGGATTPDVYTSESQDGDANDSVASSVDEAAAAVHVAVGGADCGSLSEATAAVEHAETTESAINLRRATGSARQTAPSKAKGDTKEQASVASAVTTLAALSSSADDVRRERNRLKVRRLYYRKLVRAGSLCGGDPERICRRATLNCLINVKWEIVIHGTGPTEHAARTSDQFGRQPRAPQAPAGLQRSSQRRHHHQLHTTIDYFTGGCRLRSTAPAAQQHLQHENEHLRQLVSQHVRSMHSVSVKLMEMHAPQITYLKIKAVTRLECAELRRRTLRRVRKFARNRSLSLFTDAGSFCSWQSLHLIQDSVFQFIVEKTLPNVNSEQFAQRTWSILINPDQFMKLYSLAVGMKCYVLQTVDDDNVVVFHEFRTMNPLEERPTVIRTIQLISRIHTDSGGFLISLTCLDRDSWVLDEPETHQEAIVWNDLSCWIQFQDAANSSDCMCATTGHVPIVGANVNFWRVELVQLVVRCESLIVGPASYTLTSSLYRSPITHYQVKMQRFSQWVSLAAVAALGLVFSFAVEPTRAAPQVTFADLSMNDQFNLFAPITCDSSPDAVAKWLDEVSEIMGRVAMGGVTSLPENALKAVETIANVVVPTDSLLQNKTVLRKVLAMTPTIWTSGYWYAPIATWKPLFLSVWTKPVAFAKRACDQKNDHDACEPYDAAVNATSLMIRFTKDNYFLNGENDTGAFDNPLSRGYLAFLPEVVEKLSKVSDFSLSEKQLRAYMNTIPSKHDGMDTSVAFPTFVDTARYKNSDAAALRAFLLTTPSSDNGNTYANVNGTPAQNY